MPEGWIHAVYSLDASASVNFWWNQPTAVDPMIVESPLEMDFGGEGPYDTYRATNIAPIAIPPGVTLAKKFDTRDNEIGGWFRDENQPKIPCQACTSNQHEYDKCPYLGHYRYKRISGQSCDYSHYELLETQVAAPTLASFNTNTDIFAEYKAHKPVNKPLVPIPEGITLAEKFNNRDNVMKSQSHMMKEHIDCQACSSRTHELRDCPYLGYYESIRVSGQACDYTGYRLQKSIAQPTAQPIVAPKYPITMDYLMPSEDGTVDFPVSENGYVPVNRLTPIIPTGVTLTKQFKSEIGFMSQKKTPCQACNAADHSFDGCPYLGYYKHKRISGQVCDYEIYTLQ